MPLSQAPRIIIHAYHLSPQENLPKILAEGLVPREPKDMEGDPKAVFLFTDRDQVDAGFDAWYYDRFPEGTEFALFTIDITGIPTIEGAEYEHVVPSHIPPDRILAVQDYG